MSWKLVYEKEKEQITEIEKKAKVENAFAMVIVAFGLGVVFFSTFIVPVAFFMWCVSYFIWGDFIVNANSRNILRRMEYSQENKRRRDGERTRR